ncbi:MAG: ATPase [Synergistaceae bacterium]|nr:ATPase [Synergistaceae bacterium]
MAVVGMVGMSFVGPREEIERVALSLLGMENFEPMTPEVMLDGRPLGSRFQTFRGNRYDAPLEKLDRLWSAAKLPPPRRPASAQISSVPFSEVEARVDALVRTMDGWAAKVRELQDQYEVWRAILAFGEALRQAGREFEGLARSFYGRAALGILTRENWRRLSEAGLAAPILVMPLIDEPDEKTITAAVFYGGDYREDMEKIFSSVHMRSIPLKPDEFRLYDSADAVRYRMEAVEADLEGYRNMPGRYVVESRFELEKLYLAVYTMQRVYSLCQLRGELSGMTVLAGWVPEASQAGAAAMAAEKAPHALVLTESGSDLERRGHELPTLLRNWPLVRRFQEIVRLYSLPSYNELDPTFVVAASFCLFFGFMFGDVGHGALLVLGTWLFEKKGLMGREIAAVMKVAGAVSVLFGFLYGSVFGKEELIHPLWLSPLKDVNTILPVSVGVGIAFLSLGIAFKVYNAVRRREWGEALLGPEGLAGLLFYWLALAAALAESGRGVLMTLLAVLFAAMIFGNGIARLLFHGETVDEGGVTHVFSIFHAVMNFVSNTASFVRLAAFALNHAGLSGAVFMLGEMVEKAPGGIFYHALILLLGHLVIVGLEGLIVFIQTLRLEYYEFFGKFYSGGGREFAPVLWHRRAD